MQTLNRHGATVSVICVALLSACAGPEQPVISDQAGSVAAVCNAVPAAAQDPVEAALADAVRNDCPGLALSFLASLEDAAVVEDGETIETLWTVPDREDRLITRSKGNTTQMLVTIWSDADSIERFYTPAPGTAAPKTGNAPPNSPVIWVTLTPELRGWCQAALKWPDGGLGTQAANALRVNQRLGIPPFAPKSRFAEIWVNLDGGVIRPCTDPNPGPASCGDRFPDTIDEQGLTAEAYFRWFGNTVGYSYQPTGAPWTRLGYTYDWGPDNDESPPYGASEFMLAPGAAFEVHRVYTLIDYCRP